MKKTFKVLLILIIFVYLILYFTYQNGYYRNINMERKILTDEKIQEYENDLRNGIDVTNKEYLVINNDYDNTYTRLALKLSSRVEKGFRKIIKYFFNKISNSINN